MSARLIGLVGVMLSPCVTQATQDRILEPIAVEFDVLYRIEPALTASVSCAIEKACEFPVVEGTARVRAAIRPPDGSLSVFELLIGRHNVTAEVTRRYENERGFSIRGITVTQSPGYLPVQLRSEVIGLGPPHLAVHGLTFHDATCKSERREVQVLYQFETDRIELGDFCADE